ncbi:MAG: hypothetical protein EBZ78_06200 [Verrucomicrobia bacterium]|nr:hypothetical protein [Verrucomicrobiota bacterium]
MAPTNPPLAHSIYASGLVNIFAYATELAPAHPPLAFAVTPPGGLDYVLRTPAMGPGGFCFKPPKEYCSGSLSKWDRKREWLICLTGRW